MAFVKRKQKKRVLVIGLDGATWKTLMPMVMAGELPTIKKLMDRGAHGILESTFNAMSPPAWSSAVTGVNPGKHGIYNFFKQKPNSYSKCIIDSGDLKAPAIWDILGNRGLKVGIINFPTLYPPVEVNGFFITGSLTPNEKCEYTYPSSLKDELEKETGGYVTEAPDIKMLGDRKEYAKEIMETERKLAKNVIYLMKNKEWDFLMAVFCGPDRLSHYLWEVPEEDGMKKGAKHPLNEYYRMIDGAIAEIIGMCDEETSIIVMSDHGFRSAGLRFSVNNWLISEGLMALPSYRSFYKTLYTKTLKDTGLIAYLYKAYFRLKKDNIIRGLPAPLTALLPEKSVFLDYTHHIDWSRTKAYYFLEDMIRLNVRDREPWGIVEKSEYEKTRNEIIKRLRSLRDPATGRKIVSEAKKVEEIYSGPYLKEAPDIVFRMAEDFVDCGFGDSIFESKDQWIGSFSGNHHPDGIIIVCGPEIAKLGEIERRSIMDIAPTALALLDVPIPRNMDGKVPAGIFKKGKTIEYSEEVKGVKKRGAKEPRKTEDESRVVERLSNLGYID